MALCGGLLSASLPLFPPSKRAGCSQAKSGGLMSLMLPLHGVYSVFYTVSGGSFEGFWRVREAWRARACEPKARQAPRRVRVVRAVIRRKSMAAICHAPGSFSTLPARASPVAIAPGLPDRHVRLCLRRRITPHRAARTAAQEPRQRHPEARPPAKARNAFCPVFTTGWRMLAPRAKGPQHLARPMFIDPEKGIGRLSAEAFTGRWHVRRRAWRVLLRWRPQLPRRPAV